MRTAGYTEEPDSLDPADWRAHLARLDANPERVPNYEAARRRAVQVIADLETDPARKPPPGAAIRKLRDLLQE